MIIIIFMSGTVKLWPSKNWKEMILSLASSWLVNDWHFSAQEYLFFFTTSQVDKMIISESFWLHSLFTMTPSFFNFLAELQYVHSVPLLAAFSFLPNQSGSSL